MKRKITAIISLLLVCILVLFSGCDTTLSDNEITYKTDSTSVSVKSVPNTQNITEIVIPDTYNGLPVTTVSDFAAVNLEFVTKIVIGKNVKDIGEWAFTNNQVLTEFDVDPENKYFCSVDGVLFTKDMKTLVAFPLAKDVVSVKNENGDDVKQISYIVPDDVETIKSKAFYKCQYLTHITVPDSILSIEEKAFFRCSSLKNFKISDNIQIIGKDAFAYCESIEEIEIPSSVISIGDYAFFNCKSLKSVTVNKSEAEITLGEKWYPTNNGLDMDDLKINWK